MSKAAKKGKSLVVVESPAKARTINKILGSDYVVRASMGHVRDLPPRRFGVEIENNFKPEYEVVANKGKVLKQLKKEAKKADQIYLACDLDREGEAIAWHLAEILGAEPERTHRVVFNQITRSAIRDAFSQPHTIDMDKVQAQQARRILDRIVGYQLSPLLWKKIVRGLSAGRVQSVAVRLIVDRERDIRAFDPEEYWRVWSHLKSGEDRFRAELFRLDGKKPKIGDLKTALEAVHRLGGDVQAAYDAFKKGEGKDYDDTEPEEEAEEEVRGEKDSAEEQKEEIKELLSRTKQEIPYRVQEVKSRDRKDRPYPPFITSTLQQQASIRLRFSTSRTMRVAQQLYEGIELGQEGSVGLITYMRTDSTNLAKVAVNACRGFIDSTYGDPYLPEKPRFYKSKKGAQEAHEAIRPTNVQRTPDAIKKHLSRDAYRLYKLIWERFVACQMTDAIYSHTTVKIAAGDVGVFRLKGKVLKFDGHARITGIKISKKQQKLPPLKEGAAVDPEQILATQHFTQPPPRFTEASLVKLLEKEGIGRPSTYASIIKTIQSRDYVRKEKGRFHATPLGEVVTDKLMEFFDNILDTGFTSQIEEELDKVEEAKMEWHEVLHDFYNPFHKDLERAQEEMKSVNEDPKVSEYVCEKCGKSLVYLWNRYGRFLGCSGYPECENRKKVDDEGKIVEEKLTEYNCEKCGSPMILKEGRRGKFLACSAFPDCKNTKSVDKEGKPLDEEKVDHDCPQCGSELAVKMGRRGKFIGCTAYPDCRHTEPYGEEARKAMEAAKGMKCEKCGEPMVVRTGRRGPFLGCSGYPNCRNIKPVPGSKKSEPEAAGIDCDKCGEPMVIRKGRRGPFIACTGYPDCRNTKPMSELPEDRGKKTGSGSAGVAK